MAEQEREMGKVEMYGEPQLLDPVTQKVDVPEGMEPIENLAEKLGIGEDVSVEFLARTAARRALEEFGINSQVTKAIEEMGELTAALARFNLTDGTTHNLDNIKKEMVDVWFTQISLCFVFGACDPNFFDRIALKKVKYLNDYIDRFQAKRRAVNRKKHDEEFKGLDARIAAGVSEELGRRFNESEKINELIDNQLEAPSLKDFKKV